MHSNSISLCYFIGIVVIKPKIYLHRPLQGSRMRLGNYFCLHRFLHFSTVQALCFHIQSKTVHTFRHKFTGHIQSHWYETTEMPLTELQQRQELVRKQGLNAVFKLKLLKIPTQPCLFNFALNSFDTKSRHFNYIQLIAKATNFFHCKGIFFWSSVTSVIQSLPSS